MFLPQLLVCRDTYVSFYYFNLVHNLLKLKIQFTCLIPCILFLGTVHDGRKDFKCDYCDESRTTSHSLRKHILRTHPNAKPISVRFRNRIENINNVK